MSQIVIFEWLPNIAGKRDIARNCALMRQRSKNGARQAGDATVCAAAALERQSGGSNATTVWRPSDCSFRRTFVRSNIGRLSIPRFLDSAWKLDHLLHSTIAPASLGNGSALPGWRFSLVAEAQGNRRRHAKTNDHNAFPFRGAPLQRSSDVPSTTVQRRKHEPHAERQSVGAGRRIVVGSSPHPSSAAASVQSVRHRDTRAIFRVQPTARANAIAPTVTEEIGDFVRTTNGHRQFANDEHAQGRVVVPHRQRRDCAHRRAGAGQDAPH
ncbi:hypothetical protein [Burkholderia sp. ABCPW 14]|uniref:hypothetical protein n=1 Tax=Burkholderia sp. ABCPW 14 TaxID=1637860 RepID=UPI000A994DCB|nr:hypothetical protein [Burkholderia sp. ABCPW 14]